MATGMNESRVEMLQRLLDAFNARDLDTVMRFFVDDCVLEMPRGPDPWGRRFEGRDRVRCDVARHRAELHGITDPRTTTTRPSAGSPPGVAHLSGWGSAAPSATP